MSTITISLDTDLELRFQDVLSRKRKDLSNSMQKAFHEAIELWIEEQEQQSRAEELVSLMEQGYPLGSCQYTNRSELYDQT
jgi:hypothetical protein